MGKNSIEFLFRLIWFDSIDNMLLDSIENISQLFACKQNHMKFIFRAIRSLRYGTLNHPLPSACSTEYVHISTLHW